MADGAQGKVDFGPEGFVARFDQEPEALARVQEIQRRRWLRDRQAWAVEPHWPSVRRLLNIASELGWEITAQARAAERRVRDDSEHLEYSIDVVHDNYGEAWFVCQLGDDDQLRERVQALPGAYWDGSWWVPTDWALCCAPLLDMVQSDMRLEPSNGAWLLLTEPDVSHLYLRSSAQAAIDAEPEPRLH